MTKENNKLHRLVFLSAENAALFKPQPQLPCGLWTVLQQTFYTLLDSQLIMWAFIYPETVSKAISQT